jgi:Lar family restriction alleviation protein
MGAEAHEGIRESLRCGDEMTEPLKPCPFCGSTAVCISEDDTGHARWVFCEDCECDGPPIDYRIASDCTLLESFEIIVNAWNKRAGSEAES